MSIETDVLVVKKKFKSTDSIQCILPIHCFSSWNQFWVCSSCLRLKQLPPRCSSARVTAVCESETLTSTMFFSLWSQLCDSLSVMLVEPIVGLRKFFCHAHNRLRRKGGNKMCESETLTSTMLFSLWSQLWVCTTSNVMLTTLCVEKVETKNTLALLILMFSTVWKALVNKSLSC